MEGAPNGNFVGPTVIADVTPDISPSPPVLRPGLMDCYTEEIFGPVIVCIHPRVWVELDEKLI